MMVWIRSFYVLLSAVENWLTCLFNKKYFNCIFCISLKKLINQFGYIRARTKSSAKMQPIAQISIALV